MFDPVLFGQAMGEAIKTAVAPLQAKIDDLERQLAQRVDVAALVSAEVSKTVAGLPAAKDGKDCDMSAVKAMVDEAVKSLPAPKDGKDADPAEIARMVKAAVDALPKPQDGRSITLDDVQPVIKEVTMRLELDASNVRKTVEDALAAVDERMKSIRQPDDGHSVTIDDVRPMLDEAIKQLRQDADEAIAEPLKMAEGARDQLLKAVGELRQPEDGKSVTVDDVAPIIMAEIEKAVAAIPVPKDGAGVAGAMIDRDGNLNLTLTNGEIKNLGRVEGKDGVDGISLESFDLEYLPESHEIAAKSSCAGRVKELRYPAGGIRPAGYWRDGSKAKAGDVWTRNGSMWIAKRDTSVSPEPKSEDWYLAVQRGRDGESIVKTVREGPELPIPLRETK